MTEKEIFLNMLKRVVGFEEHQENFFHIEGSNSIVIFNENSEKTTFRFDNEGNLVWYY